MSAAPSTDTGTGAPYTVTGQVTYDWVDANDNATIGGIKLNYSVKVARPARRVVVQAVEASGAVAASTSTDDLGAYSLTVPEGKTVTMRVLARSTATSNTPDSIGLEACNGASWDVKVVNNYTQTASSQSNASLRAQYAIDDTQTVSAAATRNLHAALTYSGGYTSRVAAPFAILDTIITQIEMVCQGTPNTSFAALIVNWSANNTNSSGNKYDGNVSTSHYLTEAQTGPNLYILGKENVDTDEYDDHVIAHEFAHYLEANIYRSDSIGGSHAFGNDSLDPRVAFGEGYGNALSAMTFNDPIYVDTSGANQASGFQIRVDSLPTGDERGVYSELSSHYLLWMLFNLRASTGNPGDYSRIHNIMKNYQKTTPALTTLLSFAAYYNQVYGGAAESLASLWGSDLDTSVNALCSGTCSGSGDTADPWDTDNDVGNSYKTGATNPRNYKAGASSSTFGAEFWRLYRTLTSGTNTATAHDQTNWSTYSPASDTNKFGVVRWYRYVATATGSVTITVADHGSCGSDVMDMFIHSSGTVVAADTSTSGCPTVTFNATNGTSYVVTIRGYTSAVSSYNITVTP